MAWYTSVRNLPWRSLDPAGVSWVMRTATSFSAGSTGDHFSFLALRLISMAWARL